MIPTNRLGRTTSHEWVTDSRGAGGRARYSGHPKKCTTASVAATGAILGFTLWVPELASAQPPNFRATFPVERVVGDAFGGTTEHFSIDQHGTLPHVPTEYVTVGMRTLIAGGQGLHILRYGTNYIPLAGGEALFVPVGGNDIVGYSVDTMANGDLLVAGELDDVISGTGQFNVFVCRMSRNLATIYWSKLLPGSRNGMPSVTARELRDGSIVVAHNEWPDPNGDIRPGFGRLTRLDAASNLIWSKRFAVPNAPYGLIRFADVRQEPASAGNDLWVAGSATSFLFSTAMLLEIDVNSGCPLGECGALYPHPSYDNTSFASLYFDQRPALSVYSIVAAGAALGGDLVSPTLPRVLDVSWIGAAPNWDRVYDVDMTPAPTALTVRRATSPGGAAQILVAGTQAPFLLGIQNARLLSLDANASGAFSFGRIYGNGVPPYTSFNDICDAQVMVGGRHADVNGDGVVDFFDPIELYFTPNGSSCAVPFTAADLGPGTSIYFCPECLPEERIMDVALMNVPTASHDRTICRYRMPDAIRWP